MSRIVSVWLRSWPIARLLQAQSRTAAGSPADAVDPARPLVLVAPGKGGPRLVALNREAEESGLVADELLTNARSKVRDLQSRAADPTADAAALRRLAFWCLRYTPLVAPWDEANGADGLFLDITGCAHLFGGEAELLADLARRLRRFGLHPRLAIADTLGAAWAVAVFGRTGGIAVPPGGTENALRDLPLAALRLPDDTRLLLRRLGFRRIADVLHQPRAPLATRFGAHFLDRLDQALGRAPESLSPLAPPPVYRAQATFAEAITTQEHVVDAATRLLQALAEDLARDGVGARKLRLLLFRMDGELQSLTIGLSAPSRDAPHIAGLIALRLDRLPKGLEADFGFEAAGLHVLAAEPMPERQALLTVTDDIGDPAALACLIDRLEQRLGAGAVRQLHSHQSHIPERAVLVRRAGDVPPGKWTDDGPANLRPLLLLAHPEVAEVMALIPEGPPRQFRWRGVLHQVAKAEGPERIVGEWWRQNDDQLERDYYVVEDANHRRFWLYRAGLYNRNGATPRWFVHGVFP